MSYSYRPGDTETHSPPADDTASANVRRQIEDHLSKARAIADAVQGKGRDFTAAEYAEARKHLDAVDTLKGTLADCKQRAVDAAAFRRTLDGIAEGIGMDGLPDGYQPGGYTPPGKARDGGGQAWAKAVVDASGGPGFKGVVPNGSVIVAVPAPPVVPMGQPVPNLRTLIPVEQSQGGRYSYLRQSLRQNNAAPVAPGALKPTSIYETVLVEDRCRVVAHLSQPMSRMDFADAPALGQWVSDEMFYGLEQSTEAQIIAGDGVGENLAGLAATSGIQTQPFASNLITTTRSAVTKLEQQGLAGTGWVLNPLDWQAVELSATTAGNLLMTEAGQRSPVEPAARRLWGCPVITSTACPAGVGYFADFNSTRLYVREAALIHWSENIYDPNGLAPGVGASDFETNRLRFRCEARIGFAVLRPAGVVQLDLAA